MPDLVAEKILECVVVTPERAVLDEQADYVALPMYDGELGVLPGRAPLIGRLGHGELRVRRGDTVQRFFIDGGFAQVHANVVTVLTDWAVKPEDIDVNAATQVIENSHLLAPTYEDQEKQLLAADRARAQLRVAQTGSIP
jgi:F-type H+-transporting ATPase subunit epsilon